MICLYFPQNFSYISLCRNIYLLVALHICIIVSYYYYHVHKALPRPPALSRRSTSLSVSSHYSSFLFIHKLRQKLRSRWNDGINHIKENVYCLFIDDSRFHGWLKTKRRKDIKDPSNITSL